MKVETNDTGAVIISESAIEAGFLQLLARLMREGGEASIEFDPYDESTWHDWKVINGKLESYDK